MERTSCFNSVSNSVHSARQRGNRIFLRSGRWRTSIMASADDKSPDGDETQDSPSNDSVQPSMTMQSAGYSGMPLHMYPFPPGLVPTQPSLRSKRRQVKNACTNCQKACKKCDDARPCLRCVKYGIAEECVDSQRKERKKGIKRGPYKKRDGKGEFGSILLRQRGG